MIKYSKILISALLSAGMLAGTNAFAAEFSDMPYNWTTEALQRAVENGLLNGSDGKIMPDDEITRAQMAAIIVRAFGAQKEADISQFPDVSSDKWYYSEFAKAVNMNAFSGTDDGKLNPDNFITFQECFTVVTRVFGLPDSEVTCLDVFTDSADVAEWAKPYMSAVVGNGYWEGVDNLLKPNAYITRSEFAVLMDNLVKTYINEPGTYTEFEDGNILVRSEGVTLEGLTSDDLIIVGDAVTGDTNLSEINSTNLIVLRGGNTFISGNVHDIKGLVSNINIDISKVTKRTGVVNCVAKNIGVNVGNITLGDL